MPDLYTIGYEGASQGALLQSLLFHDIETLLDIRELPQSRKPGLSKRALIGACAAVGIAYDHLRALGTPRDVRHRHRVDHDADAFRAGYLEHLAHQGDAMNALVARARSERCCLLCYEANASNCHRWFVAERVVELTGGAITIVHLPVPNATV